MTIGEKIALRRRSAGLSQEALAERLGVSRQAVSRWETGESFPDTEKVLQLCRIFSISADYLLNEAEPAPEASSVRPPLPVWRRWFRTIYLVLDAAGTALALIGLAGAILWAVQTSSWYTDWGRFGTALYFEWPGPVLLGGLLLLLIALALLAADVLLSKRDLPHF